MNYTKSENQTTRVRGGNSMVCRLHFRDGLRKVALRKRPYLPVNKDENVDEITYIKVTPETKALRLDESITFGFINDDVYYHVQIDNVYDGFVNSAAFKITDKESEDNNGT